MVRGMENVLHEERLKSLGSSVWRGDDLGVKVYNWVLRNCKQCINWMQNCYSLNPAAQVETAQCKEHASSLKQLKGNR